MFGCVPVAKTEKSTFPEVLLTLTHKCKSWDCSVRALFRCTRSVSSQAEAVETTRSRAPERDRSRPGGKTAGFVFPWRRHVRCEVAIHASTGVRPAPPPSSFDPPMQKQLARRRRGLRGEPEPGGGGRRERIRIAVPSSFQP